MMQIQGQKSSKTDKGISGSDLHESDKPDKKMYLFFIEVILGFICAALAFMFHIMFDRIIL
jgi:hypothetical protein